MKRKLMLLLACLFVGIGLVTAQTRTVTGVVISEEDGQPVIGASVRVENTQLGAITDVDGKFQIANVPSSAKTLVISYIGMEEQKVEIAPNLKVVLRPNTELLDEVVIVGYGTGKKLGSVVGAVSTVNNQKLESKPSMNFADALQGQVAGMQVFTSSGEPTSGSSMRIRGRSSLSAGTEPLYILDGAPVSSGVFTSLNPNDIESVTVLKDASSTSIYGARAANGVIYITTKRGKSGEKAVVNVRGMYGFAELPDFARNAMNAQEFMQFQMMCDPSLANNAEFIARKQQFEKAGLSMDWSDYVMRQNAATYNVDASISGSTGNTNYFVSAGHFDQDGTSYQSNMARENFRVNLNTKVNNWLKFGVNAAVSYSDYVTTMAISGSDGVYINSPLILARMGRPDDFPYEVTFNEDGSWTRGEDLLKMSTTGSTNPMKIFQNSSYKNEEVMGNLNTYFEITPVKGLTIKAAQAYEGFYYKYRGLSNPWENNTYNGSVSEQFQRGTRWTFTNTAEYKHTFADVHNMTILVGQESTSYNADNFSASGQGIEDNRLTQLSHTSTDSRSVSGGRSEYVFNSYFGRAEYNYNEKYYIEGSYRRDGSSRFSKDHRWAGFFSVGAMWNLKNEVFLEGTTWLNDLRLKASYGTTGNSEIGNYAALGLVAGGSSYNYKDNSGWVIGTVGNNDLTWEQLQNLSVGVSARVFDRVDLSVEFYNKKTTNMLMDIPLSYTTGHSSGMGNVGELTNKGMDIDLRVDLLNTNDWRWNIYANFSYNTTEIDKLFNGIDELAFPESGLKYQIGHNPYEYYAVKMAGVDPRDGLPMYYDLNGNITKNFSMEYMQFVGKNMDANWSGGFGTTLSWKGLTLMADFSWVGERYIINNDRFFMEEPANMSVVNMDKKMLTMWQKPGDITNVPRYDVNRQNFLNTDYFLENAAFLRLKNLTISYDLPSSLLKKTKFFEGVRVFATGKNLITVTDFSGVDPEIDSNIAMGNYPNARQYSFGVEVKF